MEVKPGMALISLTYIFPVLRSISRAMRAVARQDPAVCRHGRGDGSEPAPQEGLVHPDRGCRAAGAHEGRARELEQAVDGADLPEDAMVAPAAVVRPRGDGAVFVTRH